MFIFPIGNFTTTIGRWSCVLVLNKYLLFVKTSLGIWTEENYISYDIERKVQLMADRLIEDDKDGNPEDMERD